MPMTSAEARANGAASAANRSSTGRASRWSCMSRRRGLVASGPSSADVDRRWIQTSQRWQGQGELGGGVSGISSSRRPTVSTQ